MRIFFYCVGTIFVVTMTVAKSLSSNLNKDDNYCDLYINQLHSMIGRRRKKFWVFTVFMAWCLNVMNSVVLDTIFPDSYTLLINIIAAAVIKLMSYLDKLKGKCSEKIVIKVLYTEKKGVSRNPRGFHALKKGFVKN
jgi:hypothetical protein